MGSFWRYALACAAVLGACGGPVEEESATGPRVHVPAVPVTELDAAEAASPEDDAEPDAVEAAAVDALEASTIDATDDQSTVADSADAGACPSSACSDGALVQWTEAGGQCCTVTTQCGFGCASSGGGAACLPPDPEGPCAPGAPEANAAVCPFAAKTLCFDTFEAACQCLACSVGTCTPYKPPGRLKIPKLIKSDGSTCPAAGGQPPSGDAAAEADADGTIEASATDGDAMPDAASTKTRVICK